VRYTRAGIRYDVERGLLELREVGRGAEGSRWRGAQVAVTGLGLVLARQ
jgi:hypothetical protein